MQASGFRDSRFRVQGLGLRIEASVLFSGFRVQGLGSLNPKP